MPREPEAEPEPEVEPEPEPPDELFVLAHTACPDRNRWHGTRGTCVQTFIGAYHQGVGTPWQRCDSVAVPVPTHRLLLRGEVAIEPYELEQDGQRRDAVRCAMPTPMENLAGTEHDLYPLSRTFFWDVNLDATLEEHQQRLGMVGDDWPPGVHVRVGGVSHIANFASRWLDDLEGRAMVVGQSTMETSEIRTRLELAQADAEDGDGPVNRIGRQELFSPEIPDRALRVAVARMPTLCVQGGLTGYAFEDEDGGQRFLLSTIGSSVPGTFHKGFDRGAVRYRVLEEGARPKGFSDGS